MMKICIICKKLCQVGRPHNGLKNFFRFFRLRISQFEKINEKNSNFLKFFKKILSLRSRDLIMGKIGSKFFYCIFGIRMTQFVKKKQKRKFETFWPGGWNGMAGMCGMWPNRGSRRFLPKGWPTWFERSLVEASFERFSDPSHD